MKSFQKIPECEKCGSVEVALKYEIGGSGSEYINCVCQVCGYIWVMKVRDAWKAKEPTEIVESKV